ncbi:hypothetical protein FA15DRAFT_759153 [Coprinopsis marcescibilis]|uniref:Uncharacterized protein n=1 Tax=Coprinopsis marcescibilis TaxID=230819 RepID=A0A5C3KKD8_COPMA|nr:hypothetical protein FA15DRAFT_759153 [Coprinopsis marcescibilis]
MVRPHQLVLQALLLWVALSPFVQAWDFFEWLEEIEINLPGFESSFLLFAGEVDNLEESVSQSLEGTGISLRDFMDDFKQTYESRLEDLQRNIGGNTTLTEDTGDMGESEELGRSLTLVIDTILEMLFEVCRHRGLGPGSCVRKTVFDRMRVPAIDIVSRISKLAALVICEAMS